MKKFEITEYNVDRDCNVLCADLSTGHRCHIQLDQFENWLNSTDRLEWVNDWADHDGDHCMVSGKYSIAEYWGIYWGCIHKDIQDFIQINFIDSFENLTTKITEYAR